MNNVISNKDVELELNYHTTFQLMRAFHSLGSQKCRIISFLYYMDVFQGGYTDLTCMLGLEKGNISNVRKSVIDLSNIGIVYIDRPGAVFDDDGNLIRSAPMAACYLADGWMESLMQWFKMQWVNERDE